VARASREDADRLWQLFREHADQQARDRLIQANVPLVVHTARRRYPTVRPQDLEELVAAGTVGLIAAVDGWEPPGPPAWAVYASTFIRRAMARWATAEARKRGFFLELDALPEHAVRLADPPPGVEHQVLQDAAWTEARMALRIDQLIVICSAYWGERSLPEIAARLGTTPRTVQRKHVAALAVLRERLAERGLRNG
jgi:RNA polymerase sigma factor (sigma-70 family)